MHRKGRHWLLLAASLCASALPTGLIAVLGYRHALERGREEMAQAAAVTAHRVEDVLDAADRTLDRFIAENGAAVTADTARQLARVVYLSPWFREAGIVDAEGRLVATSLGPLDAPLAVPSGSRVDPARESLQVVGRVKTVVMGEYSIVLAKPLPGGGEVNLLVHPDLWGEMLRDVPLGPTGFAAILEPKGRVLVSVGRTPGPSIDAPPGASRLRSEQVSGPSRLVNVVVDNERAWFLRAWYDDWRLIAPLYLVCNVLVVGFFAHALRQSAGLGHDLRIAIARSEFVVHYQPIIDFDTDRCIAAEALLRWRHPEHGLIRPDVFIPIAEQTQQIEALTRWVLRRVADETRPLLAGDPQFVVSVNVSPTQLADGVASKLVDDVLHSGIALRQLVLEITERTLFEGTAAGFSAAMLRLVNEGVRFALDDFGSGYSTFTHLVGMRLSWMKLDKRLVQGIDRDDRHRVVLDGLIRVGRELGFRMVAEGVEDRAATGYLRARGVTCGQGWAFSPALPIAGLRRYLQGPTPAGTGTAPPPLADPGVQPV